jgi:predicted nucleotide-binding protein
MTALFTPEKSIQVLNQQISKGQELLNNLPVDSNKYDTWKNVTKIFLIKAFGTSSPNIPTFMDVGKYSSRPLYPEPSYWEQKRAEKLEKQISLLGGFIEILESETSSSDDKNLKEKKYIPIDEKSVFLVHGHDSAMESITARFIEKLGLKLIVLHEQPNKGRTIIEKFQDYSNVSYAVVLLTPDDIGGVASSKLKEQQPRARQNVVFELGYFIGKLGRKRVCALYTEGVEIPSDYSGVLFIKLDELEDWKLRLVKEMKSVDIEIDMNNAL